MKLGVSYNVFDGEELLEGSIKQIRNLVDYVSVVYQTVSNFGNKCDENLINLLNKLKSDGLIDDLYEYFPNLSNGPHYNELEKRNIGLELSKKNGCTHHMSMDSDEYYLSNQFELLKNKVIEGDYDSSFCQMISYYKSWEYRLDPPEDYYVSLIYKIYNDKNFILKAPSPVLVDQTRRIMGIKKPLIFKRNEIEMHHGSYIRKEIKSKLLNSTAIGLYRNQINNIIKDYNNWRYPELVNWANNFLKVIKVKNLFE